MDVPVADWVVRVASSRPRRSVSASSRCTGKKVALLVPVSEEVALTNPAGLSTSSLQDLPTAIARAFDYAAINGKSIRTGAAGPFGDYLALATNTVALGTATQANGGLYADIVTGAGKVIDRNFDFTGIAADPRFKVDAQLATDTQGRPLFVDSHSTATSNGLNGGDLAGYPTFFNKGVSGKYWRAGDSCSSSPSSAPRPVARSPCRSGGNSTTQAYNAAAATIQTAIQAWGGIYATVTVAGSAGGPYTITFPAITSNVAGESAPFTVDQRPDGWHGGDLEGHRRCVGCWRHRLAAPRYRWRLVAGRVGSAWTSPSASRPRRSYFDGTTWHSAFQENLDAPARRGVLRLRDGQPGRVRGLHQGHRGLLAGSGCAVSAAHLPEHQFYQEPAAATETRDVLAGQKVGFSRQAGAQGR
jgi:hypothetical protein